MGLVHSRVAPLGSARSEGGRHQDEEQLQGEGPPLVLTQACPDALVLPTVPNQK